MSDFLSAKEALGLVAYGKVDGFIGLAPGEPDMMARWGSVSSEWGAGNKALPVRRVLSLLRLRHVWARVRWRLTRDRRKDPWRACPVPPLGKGGREATRVLLREYGRGRPTPALIHAFTADIVQARTAAEDQAARLAAAERRLIDALAAGRLTVFGRPGHGAKRSMASHEHQQVPAAFFLHTHRAITLDGWATLRTDGTTPQREWEMWRGHPAPDWGDLRFRREEVAACLTPEPHPPKPLPAPVNPPEVAEVYVPRGMILIREAVRQVIEADYPDLGPKVAQARARESAEKKRVRSTAQPSPPLPVGMLAGIGQKLLANTQYYPGSSLPPLLRPLPPTGLHAEAMKSAAATDEVVEAWMEQNRRATEQARYEAAEDAARARLREALAEGDLVAELLPDTGQPYRMEDATPWRSTNGPTALRTGRMTLRNGPGPKDGISGSVALDKGAFGAWLQPPSAPPEAASAGIAGPKDAAASPASTAAAETRLTAWLVEQMRANPRHPPGKAAIRAEAEAAGHIFSDRGFVRAFANAVTDSGAVAWSAAGRKSKRRIDTPV